MYVYVYLYVYVYVCVCDVMAGNVVDPCALHVVHAPTRAILGHVDAHTARVLVCLLLRPDFGGCAVTAKLPAGQPARKLLGGTDPVSVTFTVACPSDSLAAVQDFVHRCGYRLPTVEGPAVRRREHEWELEAKDVLTQVRGVHRSGCVERGGRSVGRSVRTACCVPVTLRGR